MEEKGVIHLRLFWNPLDFSCSPTVFAKSYPTSVTVRASNLAVPKTPIRYLPLSVAVWATYFTIITVRTLNCFQFCHLSLLFFSVFLINILNGMLNLISDWLCFFCISFHNYFYSFLKLFFVDYL